MSGGRQRSRLTGKAVAAATPAERAYPLWDNRLAHCGGRGQPAGGRSGLVQTRVTGRRRKITLGRFPELPLDAARREGTAVRARLWGGEDGTPPRKEKAPLFRDFARRYRERCRHRWKPASLKTFAISLKNRLRPHFGRLRLDAASADRPGAANRAFEILRAMLGTARQWGDLGEQAPDTCANIVKNSRKPGARSLDRAELERLRAVLDRHREEHPWPGAAIRLLTLTGARLSEFISLKWDELGELTGDGASVRIEASTTGPRTIWLGPEAARLIVELPRPADRERVFPETLTWDRLHTFWVRIRDEAGLPGLRIHDCRHTWGLAARHGVQGGGASNAGLWRPPRRTG